MAENSAWEEKFDFDEKYLWKCLVISGKSCNFATLLGVLCAVNLCN